jgi:23S rRNA pseudouridine1911/1915/1917 synthase
MDMAAGDQVTLIVGAGDDATRLDALIATSLEGVSRTLAQGLIASGRVSLNGRECRKPAQRVAAGDRVELTVVRPPPLSAEPEDIAIKIVYQDPDLAIIDKPAGLVVHPAPGHASGTLANALAARFPGSADAGGPERPGIVHRLDKDTSGLMVVALNPAALTALQSQIQERSASRRYLALVRGHPRPQQGTIDAPIGRDPGHRQKMAVHGIAARPARTSYRVIDELEGFSLIEATLHTGRTHQIRVHLSAAGHPVAGDTVYGGPQLPGLERHFLHAYQLAVRSPSSGKELVFTSPLPPDLSRALARLRGVPSER